MTTLGTAILGATLFPVDGSSAPGTTFRTTVRIGVASSGRVPPNR